MTKLTFGVLGSSGLGKTFFLGSVAAIPELSPVMHILCDNSDTVLTGPNYAPHLADENGLLPTFERHIKQLKSPAELVDLIWGLKTGSVKYGKDRIPYKSLIIDNLSELQGRHFKVLVSGNDKPDMDNMAPEMRDYLNSQHALMQLLRIAVYECPQHVFFSARDRVKTVGVERTPEKYIIDVASGLAEEIPSLFTHIGRLTLNQRRERVLNFRMHSTTPPFEALRDRLEIIHTIIEKDGKKFKHLGILEKDPANKRVDGPTMIDVWKQLSPYYSNQPPTEPTNLDLLQGDPSATQEQE